MVYYIVWIRALAETARNGRKSQDKCLLWQIQQTDLLTLAAQWTVEVTCVKLSSGLFQCPLKWTERALLQPDLSIITAAGQCHWRVSLKSYWPLVVLFSRRSSFIIRYSVIARMNGYRILLFSTFVLQRKIYKCRFLLDCLGDQFHRV